MSAPIEFWRWNDIAPSKRRVNEDGEREVLTTVWKQGESNPYVWVPWMGTEEG